VGSPIGGTGNLTPPRHSSRAPRSRNYRYSRAGRQAWQPGEGLEPNPQGSASRCHFPAPVNGQVAVPAGGHQEVPTSRAVRSFRFCSGSPPPQVLSGDEGTATPSSELDRKALRDSGLAAAVGGLTARRRAEPLGRADAGV